MKKAYISGFLLALISVTTFGQSSPQSLSTRFAQLEKQSQGRLGISAVLVETGEHAGINETQHFPMQSIYKLSIAMALLDQVDRGRLTLEQKIRVEQSDFIGPKQHSPVRDQYPEGVSMSVRDLLRYTVSESDGTTSDVLMKSIGGAARVDAYLKGCGVNDMRVANTEKEIGNSHRVQYDNWSTPRAATRLLVQLQQGNCLSERSRQLLMRFLTDTPTGMKRIKGLLPANTPVAHKTGSSGVANGVAAATNDIGIITLPDGRHVAIAVFLSDSAAADDERDATIARAASAGYSYWSTSR